MKEQHFDLVGVGSMVVDLIYRTPRLISGEEKIKLRQYDSGGETVKMMVGGVTLNHLSWASLLGLRVGIFGKQADDEYGRFLRAGMDHEFHDTGNQQTSSANANNGSKHAAIARTLAQIHSCLLRRFSIGVIIDTVSAEE